MWAPHDFDSSLVERQRAIGEDGSHDGCHCSITASLRPILAHRRYSTIVATINITPPVNRT